MSMLYSHQDEGNLAINSYQQQSNVAGPFSIYVNKQTIGLQSAFHSPIIQPQPTPYSSSQPGHRRVFASSNPYTDHDHQPGQNLSSVSHLQQDSTLNELSSPDYGSMGQQQARLSDGEEEEFEFSHFELDAPEVVTAPAGFVRSQSENNYQVPTTHYPQQANVQYATPVVKQEPIVTSPRQQGVLSKFRVPPPILPPIDYDRVNPTNHQAVPNEQPQSKMGDFSYNPFVQATNVVPSTPVPVGAQWVLLSKLPNLHQHCMNHFLAVDEVKEEVIRRVKHLDAQMNAEISAAAVYGVGGAGYPEENKRYIQELIERIQQRFAAARIELIQLYLQRAKIQTSLEEQYAAAGLRMDTDEDVLPYQPPTSSYVMDPVVSPPQVSMQPTRQELALSPPSRLDELADAEVASMAGSSTPKLERTASMVEQAKYDQRSVTSDSIRTASTVEVAAQSPRGRHDVMSPPALGVLRQQVHVQNEDDEAAELARVGLTTPPPTIEREESFVGPNARQPPPVLRQIRAQSVQFKPNHSVCRRLNFEDDARSKSTFPDRSKAGTPSLMSMVCGRPASSTSRASPNTAPLQEWFKANLEDPYPSPDQKKELGDLCGLTFDQVSHWFINARMRTWKPLLKKLMDEKKKAAKKAEQMAIVVATNETVPTGGDQASAVSSSPKKQKFASTNLEESQMDAAAADTMVTRTNVVWAYQPNQTVGAAEPTAPSASSHHLSVKSKSRKKGKRKNF